MKLTSVHANRHVLDGQVNGRPLRLLLRFEGGRHIRLAAAGDGYKMTVDDMALEEPLDTPGYGSFVAEDVTLSLFPGLQNVDVGSVRALQIDDEQVGICLHQGNGVTFNFWVDGDELWWGDDSALVAHDWLENRVPAPSRRTYS